MKCLITLVFVLLITYTTIGQATQSDTFLSREKSIKVNPSEEYFLKASKGAKNYITSLLEDSFYTNHVRINFKQTEKSSFQVYIGKTGDARHLESHTYYNIHFFVVNNKDTLSYFNLLVDSIGRPTPFDKDTFFSSPTKLILSYKKLFTNQFKVDFATATTVVRQHGFFNKPFLNYQFNGDKQGFYWRVSNKLADGKRRVFDINADTGETSEFYFPAFEE